MAVIQSIYSDQKQKTRTTTGRVIQPLISPTKPILERKVEVTEPVTEKKSLVSKVRDTIAGLNTKQTGEYLKAGIKAAAPMFKQAGGIIIDNWVKTTNKLTNVFTRYRAITQPKILAEREAKLIQKVKEPAISKALETGEKLKETGFQKQKAITQELMQRVTPSTGLQALLEQAAFNLPQMMASTGLAVGVSIVTKNPALATSVALSTSYGLGASEVYSEARAYGLTDDEAMPLSTLGGIVIGAFDFVPMGRLIRKTSAVEPIKKTIIKRIVSGMVSTAVQSGTEGVTESLQEIVGGAIAKTYNENRDIFEGVTTAGLIGMLFGGLSNVTVGGIMGIKGKGATNEEVVKEVETKIGDALETNPEKRTPEQKEIVDAVLTQTLTPDQAMTYVLENKLSGTEIGNKIVRTVAEAKALNQNIRLSPTDDEKSINIELVEPTEEVVTPTKKVAEAVPEKTKGLKPITEGREAEKVAIPKELEPLAEEARKYKSAEEFVKSYAKPKFTEISKPLQDAIIKNEMKSIPKKDWGSERNLRLVAEGFWVHLDKLRLDTSGITPNFPTIKEAEDFYNQATKGIKPEVKPIPEGKGGKPQITAKAPPPSPIKRVSKVEARKTTPPPIKLAKAPSGVSRANIDRFTDIKNLADSKDYYKAVQFPEVVQMVRGILGSVPSVRYPRFRPTLGGRPLGLFIGKEGGTGEIILNPDVFASPEQAIKVFAHEVGHLADWLPDYTLKRGNLVGHIASLNKYLKHTFGDLKLKVVKDELIAVTQTWKPFNENKVSESYLKYRYSPSELYADAVSMLFNDPQLLKKTAPTFWKGFFDAIDKKPEFKNAFFETMDLLNKGEPTILSEREKNIREMFAKGEDLFKAKLLEKTQADNDIVFRLRHEVIDRNQKVIDDVNKALKAGEFVADEDNPVYYLEESNYIGGKVKAWLEKNIQPVYADLRANEVSWDDFGEVLFLERVINERGGTRNPIDYLRKFMPEVYEQIKSKLPKDIESKGSEEQVKFLRKKFGDDILGGLPLGIANPLGYDVETAQKQLDYLKGQLGSKYKVIDRNLPIFRKAIKSLIPQAYEAQLYKKDVVEKIMANPAYATFQVLDYMDTFIPASIKQQIGTLKDVANPAGSTILKAISTIRAIEKNNAKLKLVEFYKKNFPGTFKPAKTIWTGRTHIPVESKDADLKLLTLMEEGTFTGYYTDPYIADTVMNMGTGRVNAVISILRFMNSKLFRPLFITYNPGFQTFNLLRDFMRFYKNVPGMSLPRAVKRYTQALKPAVARAWEMPDKLITEMEDNKILAVTYNDVIAGLTDEDKQIDFIMKQYGLQKDERARRALFKIPLTILEQVEKTGNFIETLPKVAGYIELNGKMPSKKLASFIRTSVGSPDFLRRGAGYSWYNEVFLFSNSIKEGMRADYNVAFKNPKTRGGWWFKTAAFTMLPKFLMYAGILGLFGGSIKKMLEDVSEYDKTNYTIVPLGRDKNGRTVYLRIPQDETGRFIGGFFWKSLMLIKQKKLEFSDIAEIFSYTGGQVPSLTPSLTSTFAVTQFLAGQNPYDFFRGRNVIPDTEFKAGGSYALKPFAVWMFNQLGGGVFWRTYVSQQTPETRTWTQKIIEAPVVSNIVGRWIKVSDYGQKEINREIIKEAEQEQAKESLRRRELIDKYIELYKKDPSQKWEVERKLIEETLGHPAPKNSEEKTLRTNTLKKFEIGILRGESDANLSSLIDANTNAEKVAILKRFQTIMDQEEYNKLVRTARKYKIISDEVESASKL
jgi:hypothetical protein